MNLEGLKSSKIFKGNSIVFKILFINFKMSELHCHTIDFLNKDFFFFHKPITSLLCYDFFFVHCKMSHITHNSPKSCQKNKSKFILPWDSWWNIQYIAPFFVTKFLAALFHLFLHCLTWLTPICLVSEGLEWVERLEIYKQWHASEWGLGSENSQYRPGTVQKSWRIRWKVKKYHT